ncbi:MAG: MoxR family ATPase [Burkholderiales bacterium]|nr:MoxR family ATPase [Nitrosomonas sp.]MCP5273820.1 MoxR family ATPase [Burkholderiales bacterium]
MSNLSQSNNHPSGKEIFLPAVGTWSQSWYLLDGESQDAISLAVASGRPLLVRGLPGTGKSDLARAAAEHLERAFVYEVITAHTEPQDLLWRFDAIARLADAQVKRTGVESAENVADPGRPLHYVSPGPLWWGLHWGSAELHLKEDCKTPAQRPDRSIKNHQNQAIIQQERAQKKGTVLLLDEIDKADSELPNSLLEVLANTGFRKPWSEEEIKADDGARRPLIIITTNEDRELPPAFVRRCLVLSILPDTDFATWIKKRARVHFRNSDSDQKTNTERPMLSDNVLDQAAEQLMKDRQADMGDGPKPGLAEYLDLLRGLQQLAENDEAEQLRWLKRVYQFAYHKQPNSN